MVDPRPNAKPPRLHGTGTHYRLKWFSEKFSTVFSLLVIDLQWPQSFFPLQNLKKGEGVSELTMVDDPGNRDRPKGAKAEPVPKDTEAEERHKTPVLSLIVVESSIPVGGVARMHKNSLEVLGINDGEYVIMSAGKSSILVKAYGDLFIMENEISVRPADRRKLRVAEGDDISVTQYKKIRGGLRAKLMKRFDRGGPVSNE